MATIAEHLIALADIQSDIKTALVDKGVDMTNTAFVEYADKIGDIKKASGNAAAANVLEGKTFSNVNGSETGTMPDRTKLDDSIGGLNAYLTTTSLYRGSFLMQTQPTKDINTKWVAMSPPKGYYGGDLISTVGVPASEFGDASASNVLSGKIFTSSAGLKVTGTMTNNGAVSKSITPSTSSQTYTIPAGYHNGSGKVTVAAASAATPVELWSSTATTFAAQTISKDLSGYSAVLIYVGARGSTSVKSKQYFTIGSSGYLMVGQAQPRDFYQEVRSVQVTTTGVTFGAGYDGTSSNNTKCLPLKIYGIK